MAFALLALVLLAAGSSAETDWDLEIKILDTINGISDFVNNQSYILVDTFFGLTVAEGQLRALMDWTWTHGAHNCPIATYIRKTEEKLSNTLELAAPFQKERGNLWSLTKPDLWEIRDRRKRLPLPNPIVYPSHDISFAMQGSPNGEESDDCFYDLLDGCEVSPTCWEAQYRADPPARGYPLTHRLLFLIVAKQLGCDSEVSFANVGIPQRIRNLCERILYDSKAIEAIDFPPMLRDLFTEAVTLCGMEGFREFTKREWIEEILSWKTPSGCFPEPKSRKKRNDYIVNHCSFHFSGVAAGAIAIALRNMLEDTKLIDCMKP